MERSYVCAVLLWGQSWLKGPSAGWQAAAGTVVRIANRANCEAPKSRRFTPNREALKTIPNCPNRYLMTPAVQWELKIVGDGFNFRSNPALYTIFLDTRRLGWLETVVVGRFSSRHRAGPGQSQCE